MSVLSNLWILSCIELPAGNITQITDKDIDPGVQEMLEGGAGTLDTEFAAIGTQKPMISFTTTAVATALGIVGLSGYAFSSAANFWFQKILPGGARDGTAAMKIAVPKGLVVPKTLKATNDATKPANISYDVYAISADGTTAPISVTTGQALPSFATVSEIFTIGPMTINSTALVGLQELEMTWGMKCDSYGGDGYAYPTFAAMIHRKGLKIVPKGYDLTAISTFSINGLALTAWKLFLRKIQSGATRYADSALQHLKIAGTTGMFKHDKTSGSYDKEAMINHAIFPTFDGTNSVVTVTASAAIS
jgi:hypothetical protein